MKLEPLYLTTEELKHLVKTLEGVNRSLTRYVEGSPRQVDRDSYTRQKRLNDRIIEMSKERLKAIGMLEEST